VRLRGVSMVSPSEGWAVGDGSYSSLGGQDDAMLHYVGGNWRAEDLSSEVPASTWGGPILNSVFMTSASDGWTTGSIFDVKQATQAVLLHYVGGKWLRVQSPVSDVALHSLYTVSAQEGWAVGEGGTILHYHDGVWSNTIR
jgi:hypothetical protein